MTSRSPSRPRSTLRAPRGRPKDQDKREAILASAKVLFSSKGLAGASMDGIAADAGVSKLTLYSHFRNKEELFRQTVVAKCSEHWPKDLFDLQLRLPLRTRLRQIGRGFLDLVFSEEVLGLYRMMAADGGRATKLGQLFWEAGPQRTIEMFAQVVEAASREGELEVDSPSRAAVQFFCLLKGEHHLRTMVGAAPPLVAEARQAHVEEVVEVFLALYGTRG